MKNNEGLEFMWQAQADVWPRHAPVLFPIVGRLKNDTYNLHETSYSLSQHGFARDLEFDVLHHGEDKLVFELRDSERTRASYPFGFSFSIEYTLQNNQLHINYLTHNTGNAELLYSVGAHPGFRCPLLPTENYADYFLKFEGSTYEITVLDGGLLSNQKQTLLLENGTLNLSYSLFDADALVFENAQISQISLCSKKKRSQYTAQLQKLAFFWHLEQKRRGRFCLFRALVWYCRYRRQFGRFEGQKRH